MPTLPLGVRLKKGIHRETAVAQDLMVVGTYEVYPDAVLHGGTAIWRCFGGNRFSEDLDLYLGPSKERGLGNLSDNLIRKGLTKLKSRQTANAAFASFGLGRAIVRFEASLRATREASVRPYETVDGNFMNVRTLGADSLLAEKALAYDSRRKAKDLYDVYFLLGPSDGTEKARRAVRDLLARFEKPVDERSLRALVISGTAPTTADMLEALTRWAR